MKLIQIQISHGYSTRLPKNCKYGLKEKPLFIIPESYLINHTPSSILKHPDVYLSSYSQFNNISIEDSQIGKENFAVIETKISSIDWLYLKSSGHIRAQFNLVNEIMQGKWLVP